MELTFPMGLFLVLFYVFILFHVAGAKLITKDFSAK